MPQARRLAVALAAVSATGLGLAVPMASAAPAAPGGSQTAIVRLTGDPLATAPATRPATGKKIDFTSAAVRNQRANLSAQRNAFKKWLQTNAPKAKVTGEFDTALNAVAVELNGTALATIAAAPDVAEARPEVTYHPSAADPDLALIHAEQAWAASTGGAAGAGTGVKVAIVDTGIDVTHPCFSDVGFARHDQLGDKKFTNNKVIVAKVFYNKAKQQGLTAEALQEHGSHVAGTVACDADTPVNVNGVEVPYTMSGVAPAALLGNYNVFPGDVDDARSQDILTALEAAAADGMDVINMSLGGNANGKQDLLTTAIDNLDRANIVVAVAAGNSGPGHYTVESPGSAARALTAGASTVGHFVGAPFTAEGVSTGLASGDFATVKTDLTATVGVVSGSIGGLGDGCGALSGLTGKIAVLSRGACAFSVKIRNAQAAGAAAVIVVNNVAGDPTAMGTDGTANQPTIPAYMASLADRGTLAGLDGKQGTISAAQSYIASPNNDIMAGFSSQGPTDVDFRVKPDVVAPGVNVLSSIPHQFCDQPPCFAFFQGTSMATPHLAGSAAVVRSAHPTWSAAQVRSAIVNTADQGVLTDSATALTKVSDVNVVGTGRENLLSAVSATAALDPVSTSFGAVPAGSGQTRTATVQVTNLSDQAADFTASVDSANGAGVTFTVAGGPLHLAAGASGTLTVTMSAGKKIDAGDKQAMLRITCAGHEVGHAVLYAFAK